MIESQVLMQQTNSNFTLVNVTHFIEEHNIFCSSPKIVLNKKLQG